MKKLAISLFFIVMTCVGFSAHAERIRDLTSDEGVRENALIGYGLVVGLDGTGDQTMQTPFTTQSLITCSHNWGSPYLRAPICS